MAGVRGDFAGIARLRDAIAGFTGPTFEAQLAQTMGVAGLKQASDSFARSRDPYGRPWRPLKYRRGKPLLKTGRMRGSMSIGPRPRGFEIVITADYASFHQGGTSRIPRRQILPEQDTGGLGPLWTKALGKASEALVRRRFLGIGGRR